MTHAYDEILTGRAFDTLGRMLDFSVYTLHQDIIRMMDLFAVSDPGRCFEKGDVKVIAGMSGTELAYEILDSSGLSYERTAPRHTINLSPEYWCGYTLATIQWRTCMHFSSIMDRFSPSAFTAEYAKSRLAYLEALPLDISEAERSAAIRRFGESFSAEAASRFISAFISSSITAETAGQSLKDLRIKNGLSQSALAKASGIPVRTIQQYEQGRKDISKASADYLDSLSRALHCSPESILRRG